MTAVTDFPDAPTVQQWARDNQPREEMIFAQGFQSQISFVNSTLADLFYERDYELYKEHPPRVISYHTSKSVRLPVVQLSRPGLTITLRDNFHDWKVTVESDRHVADRFRSLFDREQNAPYYNCEGFPRELVFGPYAQDRRRFTLSLANDYQLYTFVFLLLEGWRR